MSKKIRQEFADQMLKLGSKDKSMVVLVGDISHGILQPFAKKNKDRYYNVGICEQSIVNMAAGLSKVGLNPIVHTIAPFITERAYEQIKLDFGYQKQNINLITVGGSFDYSKLGCSHHCYTDVSLISHLKNSNIVIPGSTKEFEVLFKKIYKKKSINYFRLPEYPHGVTFSEKEIVFGRGIKIKKGSDVTIAVTGTMLKNVLEADGILKKKGISLEILYFHTIKPFDYNLVKKSVSKTKCLLSVEELSSHDGIYNQCLKSIVEINNVKNHQLAVHDFIHGYGSYDEICKTAGLSVNDILKNIKKLLNKKK